MPSLQNKTVSKAASKKGTNTNGDDYVKMGIQLGDDTWYNYFVNKNCPAVEKGDIVMFLEYEEDEKWGPQVKLLRLEDKIVPNEHAPKASTRAPKSAPQTGQEQDIPISVSVMTSYHKDFVIAMIKDYSAPAAIADEMDAIVQLANEFLDASLAAGRRVTSAPKAEPNTEPVKVPEIDPITGDEPAGFYGWA